MTVRTTFVPCWCATARRLVRSAEFHVFQAASPAKCPDVSTCNPKNATVESRSKFQLGKPKLGFARLLASAKPKTSRCRWAEAAVFGVDPITGAEPGAATTRTIATAVANAKWRDACIDLAWYGGDQCRDRSPGESRR